MHSHSFLYNDAISKSKGSCESSLQTKDILPVNRSINHIIYHLINPAGSIFCREEESKEMIDLENWQGPYFVVPVPQNLLLPRMTWIWQEGGSLNSRRAKRPWLRSSSRFHNTAGKDFPRRVRGEGGESCNFANWENIGSGGFRQAR
jgi:hypothetical protein